MKKTILGLCVLFYVIFLWSGCTPKATVEKVPFTIITSWHIEPRGSGKVLLIKPEDKNKEFLKKLEAQLRDEYKGNFFAIVLISDDERAAKMQRDTNLNEKDSLYCLDHLVATYNKNPNNGYEEFELLNW